MSAKLARACWRSVQPLRTSVRAVSSKTQAFPRHNQCFRSFHASGPRASQANAQKKDHYKVLNVDRGASKGELKKAYYKLAQKYHPDKHSGDKDMEQKFSEISHSYETLADDQKRELYDQYGHDGEEMHQGGGGQQHQDAAEMFRQMFGGGGGGSPFGGGSDGGFGGFESMFGGGGGQQQSQQSRKAQASDLQADVTIDFMEAVNGCSRDLKVKLNELCVTCAGDGLKAGTKSSTCKRCRGAGQVVEQQGFFQIQMPCSACQGEGQTSDPCGGCRGTGVKSKTKDINVKIPPGVSTGVKLRVAGQGNAGVSGKGNLWVVLRVRSDSTFLRKGDDVTTDVPIPIWTALLGGSVPVPTLKGEVSLKVKPGTQPNQKVVMRDRGVKSLTSSKHGNQYVVFKVEVPKSLTKRQTELLQQIVQEEADDTAACATPRKASKTKKSTDKNS